MKSLLSIRSIWSLWYFLCFVLFSHDHSEKNQALDSTLIFIIYSSRTRLHRGIIKQNFKTRSCHDFILLNQDTTNRIELRKTVKIGVVMVIRYQGTSPKLGSCQGECPYPYDYVSFFGDGDVIFLAMMPLRIRFSSSSLLTCCLRSIISLWSLPVMAKAPFTPWMLHSCGRTSNTLFHIFIIKKSNIGRDDRVWISWAL